MPRKDGVLDTSETMTEVIIKQAGILHHEEGRRMKMSQYLFLALAFFMSTISLADVPPADIDAGAEQLVKYLNQEKIDLIQAEKETSVLLEPLDQFSLAQKIKQNEGLLTLVRAKIASLDSFLANQRTRQKLLAYKIKKITLLLGQKPQDIVLKNELLHAEVMSRSNGNIIALMNENLLLARHHEMTLTTFQRQLEEWKVKQQGALKLNELQKKIASLRQTVNWYYEKNVQLQQEKKANINFNQSFDDALKQQLNNQNIALLHHQIAELEIQTKLVKVENVLIKQKDIKTISSSIDTYNDAIEHLKQINQSLLLTLDLLKKEQLYATDSDTKQVVFALENKAKDFLKRVVVRQTILTEGLAQKQLELKSQLSMRQSLAGYQVNSWLAVKTEFSRIPFQVFSYFGDLASKLKEGYLRDGLFKKFFLWLEVSIIFAMAFVLSKQLRAVTQDKARSRLSAHLYDGVLILLSRNIFQIALLTVMLIVFTYIQLPYSQYSLLLNILLVWFIFRNLILIARMILLERVRDVSGKDSRFFYRLEWLLIAGCVVTICMVLSQQLPLSMLVQDIFTRLFMLFLFAVAIVMWGSKEVFPLLLRPILKNKKRYFRNAVSLLFVLLPITLFTTALIGMIGYMNLAWSMSRYQAYLVLVMILYVLARGLLSDALELLSEWMISRLRNGWLWIEVFLKPLDKVVHLLLFLVSVVFLFQLFGVYTEMHVLEWLRLLGSREMIDVSGVHITLNSTLEFIIVLFVFIWAAKWTREFCYRWLYRNSRDEGIRNSLSVFTQYAVILFGGYTTLRVLGLDFSGMSIVLGGLAVGMGFGLRDFASNIVGGIMLLIERPVREGDLITLGGHEGRVAHIGIRSMRVSSWDNTEVLIPNAETFNKPFINWTHQDSIVRTVVPIKVNRADDPLLIQQLIFEVLMIIPEIMNEPPTQVFLKQIDEALIEFEVRYFINIQLYTRFEIRSKFLFALMAQFKAANIRPPIPPLSVELKESDSDYVIRKKTSKD